MNTYKLQHRNLSPENPKIEKTSLDHHRKDPTIHKNSYGIHLKRETYPELSRVIWVDGRNSSMFLNLFNNFHIVSVVSVYCDVATSCNAELRFTLFFTLFFTLVYQHFQHVLTDVFSDATSVLFPFCLLFFCISSFSKTFMFLSYLSLFDQNSLIFLSIIFSLFFFSAFLFSFWRPRRRAVETSRSCSLRRRPWPRREEKSLKCHTL